jgi:hypothetical protein
LQCIESGSISRAELVTYRYRQRAGTCCLRTVIDLRVVLAVLQVEVQAVVAGHADAGAEIIAALFLVAAYRPVMDQETGINVESNRTRRNTQGGRNGRISAVVACVHCLHVQTAGNDAPALSHVKLTTEAVADTRIAEKSGYRAYPQFGALRRRRKAQDKKKQGKYFLHAVRFGGPK